MSTISEANAVYDRIKRDSKILESLERPVKDFYIDFIESFSANKYSTCCHAVKITNLSPTESKELKNLIKRFLTPRIETDRALYKRLITRASTEDSLLNP